MALDFIYNFGLYLSLFHRYGGGEMQGLSLKSCCHISILQDRQPHPTALDHGSRLHNQMMGGAWRLEEQEGEKCSGPVWSHSPTYTVLKLSRSGPNHLSESSAVSNNNKPPLRREAARRAVTHPPEAADYVLPIPSLYFTSYYLSVLIKVLTLD